MEHEKIERINELARLSRQRPLSDAEKAEQAELRQEYLQGFRENFLAILENTKIQRPDGSREPLRKKQ